MGIHLVVNIFGKKNVFLADLEDPMRGPAFYAHVTAFLGVNPFPQREFLSPIRNANHHALQPTRSLRQISLSTQAARKKHETTVSGLRAYFSEERHALRELYVELPPERQKWGLPKWLAEEPVKSNS